MLTSRAQLRAQIVDILDAAIRAVDPHEAIRAHVSLEGDGVRIGARILDLRAVDRVLVVGGGKAGTPMAAALYSILGARITDGLVNVKVGHTAAAGGWRVRFEPRPLQEAQDDRSPEPVARPITGPIRIVEAGHPVPDAAGLAGTEQIVSLLQGLTERDLVFVVISGGGSALLPLPVEGVSLADYQSLTHALLRCGADITEINAIRKHCSRLQGGQLARLAAPARVATLILSDVVGTPLDAIASGPTVPDRTTFADAVAILQRYGILEQVPGSVRIHLLKGAAGQIPDTPKPGDPLFDRVTHVVIGDNASAGRAAVAAARRWGLNSAYLTSFLQGEAREVGKAIAGLAQGIACGQSDFPMPACLVLGGETTVTLRGQGTGGRNQELALAAAIALDSYPLPEGVEVAVVSLGTDGTDGPTDAAGGIAWRDTAERGHGLGLDARAMLANNDSYHYLGALGELIITGPTQTNVNDLFFVFASA